MINVLRNQNKVLPLHQETGTMTLNHIIMKNYTAIYSTEAIKGIQYSFKAEDTEAAVLYAKSKFKAFPQVAIIENISLEEKANKGRLVFLNGDIIK